MDPVFIEDGGILWIERAKVGSPPAWQPGTNYNIGDLVVPRAPSAGQLNMMFQCVGFLGQTGPNTPVFPTHENDLVADGSIEWKTRDPSKDPDQLDKSQYFIINKTITVS